jgi:very-short-patch-repair endonuclease
MESGTRAKLPTDTLDRARRLRTTSTEAERAIWSRLRGGQLAGFKFRRQYPIPPYLADFCCLAANLVVELDGSQHSPEIDAKRTASCRPKVST